MNSIIKCGSEIIAINGQMSGEVTPRVTSNNEIKASTSELARVDAQSESTLGMIPWVSQWRVTWRLEPNPRSSQNRGESFGAIGLLNWRTLNYGQSAEFDLGWGGVLFVAGSFVALTHQIADQADVIADDVGTYRAHIEPCTAAGSTSLLTRTVVLPSLQGNSTATVPIPAWAIGWRVRTQTFQQLNRLTLSQRKVEGGGPIPIFGTFTSNQFQRLEPEGSEILINVSGGPTIFNVRVGFALAIGQNVEI